MSRLNLGERSRLCQIAYARRSDIHHAGYGRGCGLARLGDVQVLHGRTLDA